MLLNHKLPDRKLLIPLLGYVVLDVYPMRLTYLDMADSIPQPRTIKVKNYVELHKQLDCSMKKFEAILTSVEYAFNWNIIEAMASRVNNYKETRDLFPQSINIHDLPLFTRDTLIHTKCCISPYTTIDYRLIGNNMIIELSE